MSGTDVTATDPQKGTRDPLGKAALFSQNTPESGRFGLVGVECSSCGQETPLRFSQVPKLLLPFSITLPKKFHTFMSCPACGRRAWVRAHWRI